jgi:hypothetical protein
MDLMLDFNINGEVLIPLENSNFLSDKKEITYKDLYECSYNQFRNVLFQGELIKFYILLKTTNIEKSKIKSFFENLFFKIEFESTSGININQASESLFSQKEELEKTLNDLFTTNTEKINEKNYEYENVERKIFDEESQIELYEVYKQIIVPKNFLNVQLIMKLEILTKNEDAIDFKENSDTYLYYKTGHFVNEKIFKTLKTLFKEVKVVKPLNISETKQIDLTLDTSLLQIKIDNITAQTEYEYISLKNSKLLKKREKTEGGEKLEFGNDIIINEIEILEDETTIDERETEKISLVKKYIMKKNSLMQKDINFKLMENNFPLILRPGEDYSLSVKVNKSCFLTDSDIKNNYNNLIQQLSSSQASESLKTLGNILDNNNSNINPNNEIKVRKRMNSNAIVINRKSLFNQAQERLLSINNNLQAPLYTESPMPLPEIYQKNVGSKYLPKTVAINEETIPEMNTNTMSIKDFNEENIKIYYITPILLYISSKMFYENLFMCLQLKWYQELNRLLKIEIKIPEDIYLYEYFEVGVKIRNISSQAMNLLIEMKEDENEVISDKVNNFEYMPSIISQIKFQSLGMFNCNEDKIFNLKFLTTKLGFTHLPNFAITDTMSNKRFYIVQTNKIFIKENLNKKNAVNVLNRLISKNIEG